MTRTSPPAAPSMVARSVAVALAAALACGLSLPLVATAAPIDAAKSRVTATFRQMNVPVDGAFRRVAGDIALDPSRPQDARATLEIDMASFDLGPGTEDYAVEVRRKDWFDAARFPKATLVVTGARALGGDRFEANGKLTLKGRTVDLVAPVARHVEAGAQVFEGQVPIRRLAFAIGDGEWRDTSVVADEVTVRFRLVVPAAGGAPAIAPAAPAPAAAPARK